MIIIKGFKGKKSQTLSVDSYIAIALFLTTIVAFFSFVGIQSAQHQLTEDSKILLHRLKEDSMFADGIFSESEEARLVEMNCAEVKNLFDSKVDMCIYFRDSNRNIVPLTNGTVTKYGVGCPGIELINKSCGEKIN